MKENIWMPRLTQNCESTASQRHLGFSFAGVPKQFNKGFAAEVDRGGPQNSQIPGISG